MMMKRLWACLACLLLICTMAQGQAIQLEDDILSYELKAAGAKNVQEWLDHTLSQQPTGGAEWYAIALMQRGAYDFSAYCAALTEYLQKNQVRSAVTRQKYALTLVTVGGDDAIAAEILADTVGKQGIMSWVYGLHLMNNGIACETATVQACIDKLLSLQLADGGWVITGAVSDADVTAMTVQALAPYYASHDRVHIAIDRAIAYLSEIQLPDGGFMSYGKPNAESAAQVWLALSAMNIDALTDARFVKDGNTLLDALRMYQLPDKSFSHTAGGPMNRTATVQSYLAAAAHAEMLSGDGSIFVIRDSERVSTGDIKRTLAYKTVATVGITAVAVLVCVALLVLKKRNIKNFAAVVVIALALICAVNLIDIQSAADYYSVTAITKSEPIGTVTMSIRCDTLKGKTTAAHIPADGVILPRTEFALAKGETAHDILIQAARQYALHTESSGAEGFRYVSGIANIYEYDFGDLSGWLYFVNGESFSEGCDSYQLQDGDAVEWLYTCAMGEDLK